MSEFFLTYPGVPSGGGGGGGTTIGDPVAGGTANDILFVDPFGNLGQDNNFVYNQASGFFGFGVSTPTISGTSFEVVGVSDIHFVDPLTPTVTAGMVVGNIFLPGIVPAIPGSYNYQQDSDTGNVAIAGVGDLTGLGIGEPDSIIMAHVNGGLSGPGAQGDTAAIVAFNPGDVLPTIYAQTFFNADTSGGMQFNMTPSGFVISDNGAVGNFFKINAVTGAATFYNLIIDNLAASSIDTNARFLYDASSVNSVSYNSRTLNDTGGSPTIDWNLKLLQSSVTSTVDWQNGFLIDNSAVNAVDWSNRELYNTSGVTAMTFAGPSVVMNTNLDFASTYIAQNLISPTLPGDATNKAYVDALAGSGLQYTTAAQVATTTTLATLTGAAVTYNNGVAGVGATIVSSNPLFGPLPAIDGYTPVLNDRVLVKNETGIDAPHNGVYKLTTLGVGGVSSFVLTRATDSDSPNGAPLPSIAPGLNHEALLINNGTTQIGFLFAQTNTIVTVGTQNVTFIDISHTIPLAGNGLQQIGAIMSVLPNGSTINVSASGVKVSSLGITNTELATGINVNKLAALTASRAVVSDGSGFISSATTTATEIGYVNGVTSSIQNQLTARLPLAGGTMTGQFVQGVFTLGATSGSMSVNAASGNIGRVTLTGNATLANWTSPIDGQVIMFEITEDGTGGWTLSYGTKYRGSIDLPLPAINTTAGLMSRMLFVYNLAADKFDLLSYNRGY